ncbi:MAG: hypothetical protein KJ072_15980 [Verrucomicrobia bacterium]|nr:hypothetical protein [Verrucomicrobiota bacterium]
MTVLSLAAFVTGCEPANRTTEVERLQESTAKQFEAAQESTQAAIQAAGNYAEAQRTAFIAQREQGLTALRNEADDLKVRVANGADHETRQALNDTRECLSEKTAPDQG